eukprot:4211615-Ditylum_brightwellii.AAC.1
MTKELIKKKEEAVGTMSCQESVEIQAALRILDGNIRGKGSKKATTIVLPNCNGILQTVNQEEVKVSEVKITSRAKKEKRRIYNNLHVQAPDTTDNGFVALWSSLQ